ncbi:MAG: phosphoribosylglycinamide formyltransferase [Candidatus Nanopelagicales bacterium]
MNPRIVVLASGTGTLFEALLDSQVGELVVALVSDQPTARAVEIAVNRDLEVGVIPMGDFSTRVKWESALLGCVMAMKPDLIVTAGFMRVLSPTFVDAFPDQIVNSHPSLLPAFPGAYAVRDALAAGVSQTGCTVHKVDHGVDTGEVIAQCEVAVEPGESQAALHERIKAVERALLPQCVEHILVNRFGRSFK